jgi:hypothetical protein
MYYPQGTLFPGAPGTSVRAFRDKLKSSLDEVLGEIELREFPEPFGSYTSPADSIQAKLIPGIFDEIATSNGLQRLSPGRYKRESASRGIRFWFRDDLTIEYTLDAGRVPIVREDIEEALRKRFSGLQFYHFDGNKYDLFTSYVDFEKASLIQTTE